jgi:hypothetical protein
MKPQLFIGATLIRRQQPGSFPASTEDRRSWYFEFGTLYFELMVSSTQ